MRTSVTDTKLFVILLIIGVICIGAIFVYQTFFSKPKAIPTIQYDAPIGPTQEPPYQLPSKLISEVLP